MTEIERIPATVKMHKGTLENNIAKLNQSAKRIHKASQNIQATTAHDKQLRKRLQDMLTEINYHSGIVLAVAGNLETCGADQ